MAAGQHDHADKFDLEISFPSAHGLRRGRESCTQLRGLWSIVLAGGEGIRLRPFVQRSLGYPLPKQYCAFTGTRSLLQHAVDRARRLAPDERTLVVIDRSHLRFAEPQIRGNRNIRLILQPCNRDTAPGIFLPLTYVRYMDPDATVVIYPSDHFVFPEHHLVSAVQKAVEHAATLDRIILLGVVPDRLELEYGWIRPGDVIADNGCSVRSVRSFVEKPSLPEARAARELGALWNTFVLISKVKTLWRLGCRCLPDMMPHFARLGIAIKSGRDAATIDAIYETMPAKNFSTDLLQRAPGHAAVVQLEYVFWSDWGSEDRVIQSLGILHAHPLIRSRRLNEPQPGDARGNPQPIEPVIHELIPASDHYQVAVMQRLPH